MAGPEPFVLTGDASDTYAVTVTGLDAPSRSQTDPFVITGDPAPLVISEGPYRGAEIIVLTDVPLGVATDLGAAVADCAEAPAGSKEEANALLSAWTIFTSDVLVGWNLYDRRGAIPPTYAAIARVSPRFILTVLGLWADLMTAEAD